MTLRNAPTPPALVSGVPVRRDLTGEERGALLRAAERHSGTALLEIADALGLCGPRVLSSSIAPEFGSGRTVS